MTCVDPNWAHFLNTGVVLFVWNLIKLARKYNTRCRSDQLDYDYKRLGDFCKGWWKYNHPDVPKSQILSLFENYHSDNMIFFLSHSLLSKHTAQWIARIWNIVWYCIRCHQYHYKMIKIEHYSKMISWYNVVEIMDLIKLLKLK